MSSECVICCNEDVYFTCPDCQCKICKTCLKHYVLEYANLAPHCCNCACLLPITTLCDCLGSDELKTFLEASANLLFEVEIQKIPEIMPIVKRLITSEHVRKAMPLEMFGVVSSFQTCVSAEHACKEIDDRNQFISELLPMLMKSINYVADYPKHNAKVTDSNSNYSIYLNFCAYVSGITSLGHTNQTLIDNINKFTLSRYGLQLSEIKSVSYSDYCGGRDKIIMSGLQRDENKELGREVKAVYIFRCSNGDCKGFVNADSFTCELCEQKYCKKCMQMIKVDANGTDQNHECKPEDIATANTIKHSTKPCPKCTAPIYKNGGCSQMFCTNCHTGFDWNTGKIITGDFHNPHRLEWLRTRGVETVNLECTDWITTHTNLIVIEFRRTQLNHFRDVIREIERNSARDRTLYENRCLYAAGIINEDKYKKVLKEYMKNKHRTTALLDVYRGFVEAAEVIVSAMTKKYLTFTNTITYMSDKHRFPLKKMLIRAAKGILQQVNQVKIINELKNFTGPPNELCTYILSVLPTYIAEDVKILYTQMSSCGSNASLLSEYVNFFEPLKNLEPIKNELDCISLLTVNVRIEIEKINEAFDVSADTQIPLNPPRNETWYERIPPYRDYIKP